MCAKADRQHVMVRVSAVEHNLIISLPLRVLPRMWNGCLIAVMEYCLRPYFTASGSGHCVNSLNKGRQDDAVALEFC